MYVFLQAVVFVLNLFEVGLFPKTVRENLDLSGIPDEELVLKFG
jgi:hypothetical protein